MDAPLSWQALQDAYSKWQSLLGQSYSQRGPWQPGASPFQPMPQPVMAPAAPPPSPTGIPQGPPFRFPTNASQIVLGGFYAPHKVGQAQTVQTAAPIANFLGQYAPRNGRYL